VVIFHYLNWKMNYLKFIDVMKGLEKGRVSKFEENNPEVNLPTDFGISSIGK
jgi:hypothetical protein